MHSSKSLEGNSPDGLPRHSRFESQYTSTGSTNYKCMLIGGKHQALNKPRLTSLGLVEWCDSHEEDRFHTHLALHFPDSARHHPTRHHHLGTGLQSAVGPINLFQLNYMDYQTASPNFAEVVGYALQWCGPSRDVARAKVRVHQHIPCKGKECLNQHELKNNHESCKNTSLSLVKHKNIPA